ncbi:nucleotide exchange factor GrpE [Caldibacillus lycopersici]|uniref:Protein GrpE n=1 Tax=Perspicuibacillus lycopersici TaxID=1325689 RepID=A0AAE3LTG2_9BACI|nr:nucleotide exchange factor GrpE [Perspicuibacillus lycopersici]MCU9613933.1 nucleotide exchange factor GrpE [Perspicuibacillus lycopersici]
MEKENEVFPEDKTTEQAQETTVADEQEENKENVEVIFDEEAIEADASEAPSVSELQERISQLEKAVEEKDNRLLRLQADFDNYRRRTRSEIESNEKYRSQSLALGILTAIDNFERALQTEVQDEEAKSLLQGMEMIYRNILEALKKEGIEALESVGQPFDPEYHHAVMQDSNDQYEPNTVIEEFQKGYKLKDRVIRPAMVKVNQ